jgi:hypothetical protein
MADDMRLPVFNITYRSGVNCTNNEALLQRDKEEENILHTIKLACSIYDSTNSWRENATRHMHSYHRYMCRSAVPYGTYRSVA